MESPPLSSRRKRLRQWPPRPPVLISDVGVERERLIGGKGPDFNVRSSNSRGAFCVGCWEENVSRGRRNKIEEAGESELLA